jgi:riboflavin synthase
MFTGLVEEVGRVSMIRRTGDGLRFGVSARVVPEGTGIGDSVAVSGACLTVTRVDASGFEVDVVPETAKRTTLSELKTGDRVNLERSLKLGDPIGGHLVLGHVDGLARVVDLAESKSGDRRLRLRAPEDLRPLIAEKGSVALDGVSLTVADVTDETFSVALIPHTLERTTLGDLRMGCALNLEVDVLARYVQRQFGQSGGAGPSVTEKWMREEGY